MTMHTFPAKSSSLLPLLLKAASSAFRTRFTMALSLLIRRATAPAVARSLRQTYGAAFSRACSSGSAAPAAKTGGWDPYAEDKPHTNDVMFGPEFTGDGDAARDAELRAMWEDSIFASAKGIKKADDSAGPREVLLYRAGYTNQMRLALTAGVVPVAYGGMLLVGRLASLFPVEYVPSYLQIAFWLGGGALLLGLTGRIANFKVREAILTQGGSAVRLRTFRALSGFGPSVTLPAGALSEEVMPSPDAFRYLRLSEDAPKMMLHRQGEVLHPEALERVLAGLPVHLSHLSSPPEDAAGWPAGQSDTPAEGGTEQDGEEDLSAWRVATDEAGRKYYWHSETRETRWTRPGARV